jgi:hypothetical protein
MDKFDELNNGLSGFPMIIAGVPAEYATVTFTDSGIPVQQESEE